MFLCLPLHTRNSRVRTHASIRCRTLPTLHATVDQCSSHVPRSRQQSRAFSPLVPRTRRAISRSFRNVNLIIPRIHVHTSRSYAHHAPMLTSPSRPSHTRHLSPCVHARTRTPRSISVTNRSWKKNVASWITAACLTTVHTHSPVHTP